MLCALFILDFQGDVTLCSYETFDPLSRYAPTLVEAKLDRYLANHLKEHSNPAMVYHAPVTSSPYRPSGDSSASSARSHDPAITKLWQSVNSGVETIKVGDILLSNPRIVDSLSESGKAVASQDPSSLPPPTGFVVAGDIKLFASPKVKARVHKWHGPAPSHVKLRDEPLCVEFAYVDGDFHLSSVMRSLEGTAFDKITFRKATFYHQNCNFDESKSAGWHFEAELVVDQNLGGLYQLLTKVLGVTEKTLQVRTALGLVGEWKTHFDPHSFMLNGLLPTVPDAIAQPVPGVRLTTIGVRLMAIRQVRFQPSPESVLRYGFGVYGTMGLSVPDSIVPLPLQYEMRESNGNVQIGATVVGDIWYKPFGVPGVVRPNNFDANANG
jgi:hypothetical protein